MNRSILIVICDFLLVSLLAFSTVDINKVTQPTPPNVNLTMVTNQVETEKDLTSVMRLALDEERKRRDQMAGELAQAHDVAGQRDVQVANIQKQLQAREQQQAEAERRQAELQQRFAAAETNLQTVNQQLQSTAAEALRRRQSPRQPLR